MPNHVILRQIVELETPSGSDGHASSGDGLSLICRNRMPRMLEAAFDRCDVPAARLCLDKLYVEIECQPGETVEEAIDRHLAQAVEQAIQAAIADRPERISRTAAESDWLLFFLEHGYLPWYAGESVNIAEWEYRIAEALAREPGLGDKLFSLLQRHPAAVERLLRQFSANMPQRILLAWRNKPDEDDWLPLLDYVKDISSERALAIWKNIFGHPEQTLEMLKNGQRKALEAARTSESDRLPEREPPAEEGIFIRNAGLVLLHPFIEGLFRATGHCTDSGLNDPVRAIGLLHYACNGNTEAGEWELPLLKILCGVSLSRPLPAAFEVLPAEMTEIETMLKALIRHWSVLKNTSVGALRESFLQRPGKLSFTNGYWRLTVEQRVYDILLEHLPWGIGMVKLPWMPEMVVTEWV